MTSSSICAELWRHERRRLGCDGPYRKLLTRRFTAVQALYLPYVILLWSSGFARPNWRAMVAEGDDVAALK